MDGLKGTFEGEVDFFDLDIDDASLNDLRRDKGISGRSQYVLLAPDGETVLQQWFGPLSPSTDEQIAGILKDNGY